MKIRWSMCANEAPYLSMIPQKLVCSTGGKEKTTLIKLKLNLQRCSDGSDGRRGFVSTPANDTDWPVCKYGTTSFLAKILFFSPIPNITTCELMDWTNTHSRSLSTLHWAIIIPAIIQLQFAPFRLLHPLVVNDRQESKIEQDFKFLKRYQHCCERFHTLWYQRSPRTAVRWTTRRTNWSVSLSRLLCQTHNWICVMESSSSIVSLSVIFFVNMAYFRRAFLWRLHVTARRSWVENFATGRRTRLKCTLTAFMMPQMRYTNLCSLNYKIILILNVYRCKIFAREIPPVPYQRWL